MGVPYFTCKPLYGVFAPPSKVTVVTPTFSVGDRVYVGTEDRSGVIKFVGPTQFAAGEWIGIALDQPCRPVSAIRTHNAVGKNDGSVQGVRYFTCPEKHGVFSLTSKVILVTPYAPGEPWRDFCLYCLFKFSFKRLQMD